MSFDIELLGDDGLPVTVDQFTDGGTHPIGGTDEACLNVTYNYAPVTKTVGFSFRDLNDRVAGETISTLERVVVELGTEVDDDYWAATPGNAGHAANILLSWARKHPHARWDVR